MAYDLNDEDQIKQYLTNVETEYSYQCMSEKEPDGCHRLADFLYSIKSNEKMGRMLFKKTCDEMNYADSCFKYAGISCQSRLDANPKEGVTYFEKSCDLGNYRGCANAGMMHLKGFKVAVNTEKGLHYLEKACTNNRGEACTTLGISYLAAKNRLPKDIEKATRYLTMGCELGSYSACGNLSAMFKLGQDVTKDTKLAEKYKAMALKIKKEQSISGASSVRLGGA